ncbi:MAG TPA: hypothetical protein PKD59_07095 [Miltoncostaeaceae bacterium]|nr:hypothetical protein [Miltoncostaeaceae bacterium]
MGAIPIDVAPDAAYLGAGATAALMAALDAVAVRASVTRLARRQDWDAHAERVDQWCWAALGDALDDLAALAPEHYGPHATARHRALLRDLRRDLGLPPADEG